MPNNSMSTPSSSEKLASVADQSQSAITNIGEISTPPTSTERVKKLTSKKIITNFQTKKFAPL